MQRLVLVLQQFTIVVEHAKTQTENDLLQVLKELSTALKGFKDGKSIPPRPDFQVKNHLPQFSGKALRGILGFTVQTLLDLGTKHQYRELKRQAFNCIRILVKVIVETSDEGLDLTSFMLPGSLPTDSEVYCRDVRQCY